MFIFIYNNLHYESSIKITTKKFVTICNFISNIILLLSNFITELCLKILISIYISYC